MAAAASRRLASRFRAPLFGARLAFRRACFPVKEHGWGFLGNCGGSVPFCCCIGRLLDCPCLRGDGAAGAVVPSRRLGDLGDGI
ncbi:hypothetical protein NL676_020949 [Syzygium grande]|nr:hypothetical protein NL676_020949 [Syzygium grande]